MTTVRQIPNHERYTKCASCRATATRCIFAEGHTVTRVVGGVAAGWNDPQLVVSPWQVTTCERHAALNLRRAHAATSTFVIPQSAPASVHAKFGQGA